jgi:hypothetical protein
MSSALSFGVWSLIPLLLITLVAFTGDWIYRLEDSDNSPRANQAILWLVFSAYFFLACWLDLTLLGSISASDKPPLVYLGSTALGGAAITLIGQIVILPWISFVYNCFTELSNPGGHSRRPV